MPTIVFQVLFFTLGKPTWIWHSSYLPVMSFFLSVMVEGEQSHFFITHLSNQCTHGTVLLCEERRGVYPCLEDGCIDGQTKAKLCRSCINWTKDETWDLEGRGEQARSNTVCAQGTGADQGVGRKGVGGARLWEAAVQS